MNKEELEKLFDNKFEWIYKKNRKLLKDFIFDEVIPEVIKSVLTPTQKAIMVNNGQNILLENIKVRAKELYNIEL